MSRSVLEQQWKGLAPRRLALILAGWAGVFVVAYIAMQFVNVPAADWYHDYADFANRQYLVYPPWIAIVMWPVRSLAAQNALTLTVLAYALWRYQARPIHYLLAFTAMPVYWNLWLGQNDYIPLLGMFWLPWGLPLVALKPQMAIWGALAWWLRRTDRWRVAAAVAGAGALSLVIYGWWPGRMRLPVTYFTGYNLSAWRWGGIAGGVLAVAAALYVTFRQRDIDASMALGSLAAPYVQGNSYLLLLPAFARLSGWRLVSAWLASWSGVVALLLGDAGRPLIAVFPVAMWALLTWGATRPAEDDFRVSKE
jgi:hypothetical protein